MKYIGEVRPLWLCLLLSIVSLGLFNIYWAYTVSYEVREAAAESRLNPKVELVGSILTFGVYLIYWVYKYEKYIVKISREQGLVTKDLGFIMALLSMFFLFPISMLMMQRQLNNLWETVSH